MDVDLSPWIHQEYTFRHRSTCRTPTESRQEYLTNGKEYIEPCKLVGFKGTRGKNRSVRGNGPALSRSGNWSRGQIPTSGQLAESEEKHLKLNVTQLICDSLNGMRIRQSLPQPYIPWTGTPTLEGSGAGCWTLGILEPPQDKGCCWLQGDGLRGCKGGDCGRKREVYSNTILPQETRKTLNRQPNYTPKTTEKKNKTPQLVEGKKS